MNTQLDRNFVKRPSTRQLLSAKSQTTPYKSYSETQQRIKLFNLELIERNRKIDHRFVADAKNKNINIENEMVLQTDKKR